MRRLLARLTASFVAASLVSGMIVAPVQAAEVHPSAQSQKIEQLIPAPLRDNDFLIALATVAGFGGLIAILANLAGGDDIGSSGSSGSAEDEQKNPPAPSTTTPAATTPVTTAPVTTAPVTTTAVTTTAVTTAPVAPLPGVEEFTQQMINEINTYRQAQGLGVLVLDDAVTQAAQDSAEKSAAAGKSLKAEGNFGGFFLQLPKNMTAAQAFEYVVDQGIVSGVEAKGLDLVGVGVAVAGGHAYISVLTAFE